MPAMFSHVAATAAVIGAALSLPVPHVQDAPAPAPTPVTSCWFERHQDDTGARREMLCGDTSNRPANALDVMPGDDNLDGYVDEDESGWNCATMGNRVCGPNVAADLGGWRYT